jgi:drug/metabolite transporter (DMT)-like permease
VFGIVLNQALFLRGLRETSPVAATLLVATIPIFSVLVAALAGRDRLTARGGVGIGLAVLGIATLSGFVAPRAGDALVLANAASYALYVVFAKGVLARYGTTTVVAWVFGWGAILFAPIGGPALVADLPTWSLGAWLLVAFVVLVPTVLAYSVNAWALRRATPSLVTVYIYLQPLVVVALARVQLGQAVDLRTAAAAALILGGVGVVATAPRRAEPSPVRAADVASPGD